MKIQTLISVGRLGNAEDEVRQEITKSPDDAYLHCLLGVVLHRKGRLNEAEETLRHSIELDPEDDDTFAQLGAVLSDRNQYKPAMEAIDEAIRLAPEEASHFGLKSSCLYAKGKWSDSLEAARTGLELDAEEESCRMFHSLALAALGHTEAADAEALSLLNDDPDSADSQIARGLVLMESNPQLAQKHFLEALRIDPTEDIARNGLASTMKLQNPVVGWFMKALSWLDKFPMWGIFVIFLVASRIGRILASTGVPLIVAAGKFLHFGLMLFCLATLIQRPLFDILLHATQSGRHALDPRVRDGMKWIYLVIAVAIGFAFWSVFDNKSTAILHAFLWCAVAGLVYEVLICDHRWVRKRLLIGTLAATVCGVGFLAYDLGSYRPQTRLVEAKHLGQAFRDFEKLGEDALGPEKFQQEMEEIGRRNDKKYFAELNSLRRRLLYLWGPVALAIVLASAWSDEIADYLYGKAPDQ